MPTVRTDPFKIDSSLKEAVADGLLNITHARVAGTGEFGQVLYGIRPRSLLVSGFLLPMRDQDDGDEVTSPIWIASHGLDFQIAHKSNGLLHIQPGFSLYARVLPNEEDLKRPDCGLAFRLRSEISRSLRQKVNEELKAQWELLKGKFKSRRECLQWPEIQTETRKKIYTAEGIPLDLNVLAGMEGEAEISEGEVPEGIKVKEDGEIKLKDEHFSPLSIPQKWRRLDIELPILEVNPYATKNEIRAVLKTHEEAMAVAVQRRLFAWMEDEDSETGGKLWAYRTDEKVLPSQYWNWKKFLEEIRARNKPPSLPKVAVKWDIEISPDWLDSTRLNVHVALENRSEEPRQHVEETEQSIFQVSVLAELPTSMHCALKLERVKPSYRYNRYLNYPALGFNGGVIREQTQGDLIRLRTTWAPRYTQPRILPVNYEGVVSNMRALSRPEGIEGLPPIVAHFRQWLKDLPGHVKLSAGIEGDKKAIEREEEQFHRDCGKWELEASAIDAGIRILLESKKHWCGRGPQQDRLGIPFEAWLAMNEGMADLMKLRQKNDSADWRLFQLAFVLANLPAIATRMPEYEDHYVADRDDAVTLLYFATGGGKSEAFFGLLSFALFLDRLRGKSFGVTSMIRYPLRLLTIQQAQRAAKVLAQAELVRRKYKYGGKPFSIGFWVGSGGSPNRHNSKGVSDVPEIWAVKEDETTLRDNAKYAAANRAWNKLPVCPFCGAQTGLRRFEALGDTLAHVCTSLKCESNEGQYRPLPFYICDDDIYDLAPSVVLGTVDKLALIGHSAATIRRVLGMFGTAPWVHEATGRLKIPNVKDLKDGPERSGCRALHPAYESGEKLFHDPFPALLIQDEAHLLDESLGTFAGLFESTLDAMFEKLARWMRGTAATDPNGKRRRVKVIAASATVSEPERQLEHLYQRRMPAIQFPHPGPDVYTSFYAAPQAPNANEPARVELSEDLVEVRARQARLYCAYMTNGKPHTATSIAILSNFHLTVTELFELLVADDAAQQQAAKDLLKRFLSNTPIRPIHEAKLNAASASHVTTLIDLHRIALTYVTNKKGGDQIQAAEAEETRKKHAAAGRPLDALHTRLITGSVEQGEIQKAVELAQDRLAPEEPFTPKVLHDALRSIIATSAVSHGVDVEELNSMFFAGMPSDIAEYIQASSRIGRTHVGFCVLIPTPQRRRDRYIVEVFDIFHRFLERMVQPAAIDRWAEKAVHRVIPSLFQACVCGVRSAGEFIRTKDSEKYTWRPMEAIPEFISQYEDDRMSFVDGVSDFIDLAIGLTEGYAPEGKDHYEALVKARVRKMLEEMAEHQNRTSALRTFFNGFSDSLQKPMTSLRDVDQAGRIRLAAKDTKGRRLSDGDVVEVMALVRHGVAEVGDEE
ncbi:MAG: hypothetical protein K8F53_07405 [Rhodocyclaceae bacterium]|nr:hypothetical protein [Rhodocyclaceae bacterium]